MTVLQQNRPIQEELREMALASWSSLSTSWASSTPKHTQQRRSA